MEDEERDEDSGEEGKRRELRKAVKGKRRDDKKEEE